MSFLYSRAGAPKYFPCHLSNEPDTSTGKAWKFDHALYDNTPQTIGPLDFVNRETAHRWVEDAAINRRANMLTEIEYHENRARTCEHLLQTMQEPTERTFMRPILIRQTLKKEQEKLAYHEARLKAFDDASAPQQISPVVEADPWPEGVSDIAAFSVAAVAFGTVLWADWHFSG